MKLRSSSALLGAASALFILVIAVSPSIAGSGLVSTSVALDMMRNGFCKSTQNIGSGQIKNTSNNFYENFNCGRTYENESQVWFTILIIYFVSILAILTFRIETDTLEDNKKDNVKS